jgi:hypothetical protein
MHAGDWIALVPTGVMLALSTFTAVWKLAKLVDAVERLGGSMERIAGKVDDHEGRLAALEVKAPRTRNRAT